MKESYYILCIIWWKLEWSCGSTISTIYSWLVDFFWVLLEKSKKHFSALNSRFEFEFAADLVWRIIPFFLLYASIHDYESAYVCIYVFLFVWGWSILVRFFELLSAISSEALGARDPEHIHYLDNIHRHMYVCISISICMYI